MNANTFCCTRSRSAALAKGFFLASGPGHTYLGLANCASTILLRFVRNISSSSPPCTFTFRFCHSSFTYVMFMPVAPWDMAGAATTSSKQLDVNIQVLLCTLTRSPEHLSWIVPSLKIGRRNSLTMLGCAFSISSSTTTLRSRHTGGLYSDLGH